MRKHRNEIKKPYSILTVDDDPIMTSTIQAYFQRSGYKVDVENDPYGAIEKVREGNYDILLLDFLMSPICGNQVVEEIRKFNKSIYIILLTGHKSMAPPMKTIRELDIQAYYEKNDRFDQLELLVESCVKSICQIKQIKFYEDGLSKIIESMPHIHQFQNIENMCDMVSEKLEQFALVEESFIFIGEGENKVRYDKHLQSNLEIDETIYEEFEADSFLEKDGFWLFPLWSEGRKCFGILGMKISGELKTDQIQLLRIFTRQVSSALLNSKLHFELNEAYLGTVTTLRYAVEAKDYYTRGHSDRVSKLAVIFSEYLNKDEKFVNLIQIAGLFHDVGKIGIPDRILLKTSKLTEEEFKEIQKHPEIGVKILSGISNYQEIMPMVRGHHERVDGKGYPDGLKGDQIAEGAKIIAIVDAFDAMISNRPYRKGKSWNGALDDIVRNAGTQFDEELGKRFIEMVDSQFQDIKLLYGVEE